MLSRVQNQLETSYPLPKPANQAAGSGQVFSVSLDTAMLETLVNDLSKAGFDTGKLNITDSQGRQVSVATQPGSQNFDTSAAVPAALSTAANSPFDSPPATSSPAATNSPAQVPFVPQFQNVQVLSSFGGAWDLNPMYFATRETADWLAKKYGTGEVVEAPYGGQGGPFAATANQYEIKLQNGKLVNAGLLADYYRRAPEDKFPGVADEMIRADLIKDNGPDAV